MRENIHGVLMAPFTIWDAKVSPVQIGLETDFTKTEDLCVLCAVELLIAAKVAKVLIGLCKDYSHIAEK
jgi:hypothetical protein